jgi:hypothetical protein
MSTLKADTIQSTSGGAATLTKQHAAKAWVKFDGSVSTPAALDSFNHSSVTDSATGSYINNLSSAMSNVNYMMTTAGEHDGGSFASVGEYNHDSANTTTASKVDYHNVANSSAVDVGNAGQVVHGDLA